MTESNPDDLARKVKIPLFPSKGSVTVNQANLKEIQPLLTNSFNRLVLDGVCLEMPVPRVLATNTIEFRNNAAIRGDAIAIVACSLVDARIIARSPPPQGFMGANNGGAVCLFVKELKNVKVDARGDDGKKGPDGQVGGPGKDGANGRNALQGHITIKGFPPRLSAGGQNQPRMGS